MLLIDWSFICLFTMPCLKKVGPEIHYVRLWQSTPSCTHAPAYENSTLIMHSIGPKPNFGFILYDTI
jgi:hypothetical protein